MLDSAFRVSMDSCSRVWRKNDLFPFDINFPVTFLPPFSSVCNIYPECPCRYPRNEVVDFKELFLAEFSDSCCRGAACCMHFLYWKSTEPAVLHTTLGADEPLGGRTLQRVSPETSLALFPTPETVAASPMPLPVSCL